MDSMSGPRRNFVGYGRTVPRVTWPNNARVALSIVVNYEEGSERSLLAGDGRNEGLGEVPRAVDSTYRDLATESVYEYGSRAGIFRILRMLDDVGIQCTFFAAAQALEFNQDVCTWIREAGHEPCAHGWRWSEDWLVDRETEKHRIHQAVTSIARTCGQRPVGWYNRWMPSVHTRELLVEEGGFLYDSNAYNDDLPYYVEVLGRSHLVVPYTLTYNDVRYISGGSGSPSDFFDYCKRGLDYLWEEGADYPRVMSVGVHSRWTGQAARAHGLREFLRYAQALGGVWFARRVDIAKIWMEQFPPE